MVIAPARASRSVDAVHQPVATAARGIRRALRTAFAQWELSTEVAENALLVVEELVANVVDHARTPFRLTVHHLPTGRAGSILRIVVRDGSTHPLHVRPFDARAGRGRGLAMINALTSRWGCDRTPGWKTVWADLPA